MPEHKRGFHTSFFILKCSKDVKKNKKQNETKTMENKIVIKTQKTSFFY